MADLGLPGRKKAFDPQQRLEAIHAPLPVRRTRCARAVISQSTPRGFVD